MANVQKDLKLYYQGVDITDKIAILECVVKDTSGGQSDCLNLKIDHADKWFKYGAKKNDVLRVTRGGYDSMNLYLNTVAPEEGAYRIYATGRKCVAFPEKWQSWEGASLTTVMGNLAGEGGMGSQMNGVSGGISYPYLLREHMGAPAFLEQLLNRESAVLKCMNGKFCAIGIPYAQNLKAMQKVDLGTVLFDGTYVDRRDTKWRSVTIETPFGSGKATDPKASDGKDRVITEIAATDAAMAKRWAKGILLCHNRKSEILTLERDFNPGYTAMVKLKIGGGSDAAGEWLIDTAEQDLLRGRSRIKLLRCTTVN